MAGFGGKAGGWKNYGKGKTLERSAIKGMAKVVYVCRGCGAWNRPTWDKVKEKSLPPKACISSKCGRMDFDYFQSEGEAMAWARLLLRQSAKEISEVERQVRIPLLAFNPATGKPVEFAVYVADFRWLEDGRRWVGEYKPDDGMSKDAELKIRCVEAMGIPVIIINRSGEVGQ